MCTLRERLRRFENNMFSSYTFVKNTGECIRRVLRKRVFVLCERGFCRRQSPVSRVRILHFRVSTADAAAATQGSESFRRASFTEGTAGNGLQDLSEHTANRVTCDFHSSKNPKS